SQATPASLGGSQATLRFARSRIALVIAREVSVVEHESTADTEPGAPSELAPGTPAGDYIVADLIARGGCGSVYRAHHKSGQRVAALKVLHGSLAVLPKMVERFAREVRVVGMLRHPNIVEILEVGTLPDQRPFYAM